MSNSFKRFLSLALALMMVISMMPTTAFATDGEGTQPDAVVEDIIPETSSEPEEEPSETTEPEEEPSVDVCTHENQTTTTEDATCEADGSVTVTCDDCGEVLSEEAIPAGHKYVDGICELCGETDPNAVAQIDEGETPTEGYMLYIYNADGTVGYTINGTKSISAFSVKSAIEDARVFVNNAFMFGITTPATYVVEMYEDSIEDESFEIGSDVTINGNGHKIVCEEGVVVTNNGTLNDATIEMLEKETAYVAMIGEQGYETLQAAIDAAAEGSTITLVAGATISEGTIKLPATMKRITINGAEGASIKDTTIMAADGNNFSYVGLTFDGVVFDNSRLVFTGWRNGEAVIENLTITNCVFKNLYDTTNNAAVHINKDVTEPVKNFAFTNNVIDGATGGSKSGIYSVNTGKVIITGNTFNNIVFRPALVQLADCDGLKDEVVVSNNKISNTTRLQIYGSEEGPDEGPWTPSGTDTLSIDITDNIFQNISGQYICTWGINGDTDIAENYYDEDISGRIYWNNVSPTSEAELAELGVYPIYTELNDNGTINTESAYEPTSSAVAEVNGVKYEDIQEAIKAAAPSGTVELLADVTVDKWNMISEALTIGDGSIITLDMNGLTIDGNGHKLTINDVESANNGGHIFYDGDYNVYDLTLAMGANVNGLGITSGTISDVTFTGGHALSGGAAIHVNDALVAGVHAGNVTVDGCTFQNNGGAIYYETAQNGLVVNENTFELADSSANVIIMRGSEQFTDNTVVSGRTVNIASGSPVVTGNNFNDVRLKVYNEATATITNNTINNLAFNDATPTQSTFTGNTLSESAQAALDAVSAKPVAKIGEQGYATLADALAAAKTMTGNVVVEIYDKVTLADAFSGSYDSIKFVGMEEDAEIYLDVQGYITATGKKVAFEDLTLSKVAGGYIANAGFMNLAFGVYDVAEVTYTDCYFANGAYASSGKVTFSGCTFKRSHDRYGLWAYGDVDAVVDGCTFADIRGIKMYDEGKEGVAALTVKNTNFSAVDNKPAIVLTYGERVTLEGNIYNETQGVFELDLDGAPNGTPVTSDVAPTCINDNGACGVLVDGKIYTTVAQAAEVATSGSKVTLLHNSAETVELAEGVVLDKNGFEAAGVTVKVAAPTEINSLEDLIAFRKAVNGGNDYDGVTVTLNADIDLAGAAWTPIGNATNKFLGTFDGGNHTISNLVVDVDTNNAGLFGFASVIKNVNINNAKVSGVVCVGALVGELESSVGTVDNCHVSGTIQITGENSVGGLAGKGYATIKNSSVDGNADSFVLGVYGTTEEGDNIGGLMGHLGEGNTLGVNNVTVKNITVKGTRKVGGILGTTARGNDIIGCTVDNVVIESTATAKYADANASTTTIGGVIGNYFGSAASGGVLKDCSVTNVNLVIGNAKSAGALVGGDRNNNGGAPVGVDTVSGNTVSNVTGATNKYLMPTAEISNLTETVWSVTDSEEREAFNVQLKKINAYKSLKVEVYHDDILLTTTTLKDELIPYVDNGTAAEGFNRLTVNIVLWGKASGSWDTKVETENLTEENIPNYIKVYCDGKLVAEDSRTFDEAWIAAYKGLDATAKPAVAKIGETGYATLAEAFAAAKSGDTITLLADVAMTETYNVENMILTIDGNGKLTLNDMLNVYGESTLNISAPIVGNVNLGNGAILKDSTINGDVFVAGKVIFRGTNTVNMLYDYGTLTDYYGTEAAMEWSVESGATLNVLAKARYGLGYGDKVTITGSLDDALTARDALTQDDASFFTHGLVAQESKGWNCDSSMIVEDAYAIIGSNNSFGNKPGNYGGTYTFNFTNAVLDSSRITFYEALSTTEFNFTNSDVKTGTFMTRDADSIFALTNTKLLSTTTTNGNDEGNYHAGKLVLANSDLTYSAPWELEGGTVQMDVNSTITAPSINGAGKIVIDATGIAGETSVINADMSGFTGTVEVTGAEYEITENGLVIKNKPVAKIGDETYATLQDAIDAAQAGDEIVLLDNLTIESDLSNAAKGYFNIAEDDKIIIDLNGKKITATDKSSGNFILFYNYGELTIKNGTVELTATNDRAWNAQSTIILNRGGNLTIESGSYIHKGGTAMAYVVDNSGNSYGDATTTINGGILNSAYIGIRNRMDTYGANGNGNGIAKLVVNGGEISGKYAVWGQVSSSGCKGEIVITGGKLSGAAGKAALLVDEDAAGEVKTVVSGGTFSDDSVEAYLADGYALIENEDGTYGVKVALPEVVVTDILSSLTENDPELSIALNFAIKDVDKLSEEYLEALFEAYGDYYTDYVLTISDLSDESVAFNANGGADGYLAGQYDAWSENWVSVPFEDVTVKNGESLYIMEYAAKLMGQSGLRFTLAEVAEIVQNFDCGVYFTPEFLNANPNMKVTLELKVFTEDEEGNKINDITVAEKEFNEIKAPAPDVAEVNGTKYKSLQAAIDAAQARETVTVIADIALTETVTVPAGKTVTLDLNGYTISQTKECTASYEMISNKGNLTILDSSDEAGKISFTDTSTGDPSFGWGSYTIRNEGTLEVNDVTIEHLGEQNTPAGAVHMYCAIFQYSGSTTINSGKISTPTYRSVRLWKGDMTINGGEFEGQVWVQAVDNTSKLTIKGGSFAPCGGDGSSVFITNATYDVALAVNGGTFNTKIGASAPAKLAGAITGGQFTEAAKNNTSTAMLADGYAFASEANENGLYTIVKQPAVAKIGETCYESFEDALAAASADSSIKEIVILCDSTVESIKNTSDYYNISGNLTITAPEGENYTVTIKPTGTDSIAVKVQGNGASLTIAENVTINWLDIVANGFYTTGENMIIEGTLYAKSLKQWTSNGSITVTETGKVVLGNSDGQFDLNYGSGSVSITGTGVKTAPQFKAGYTTTQGYANGNVLDLKDTYFEGGAWFNLNGSNGTINADNALIKVSGGDASGSMTIASSGNKVNLTNGSELAVAKLTLGAGNEIKIDGTSKITATTISGEGTITIDATDMVAGEVANITGNASGFTGKVEAINTDLEAKIVDGKIVLVESYAIEVTYADGTVEYFNDILKAVPYKTNYDKLQGATVKLLKDVTGKGVRFMESDMVFDLNGHTFTINNATGSSGTNTSGFQIRAEANNTTIKNGTIKIADPADMVENPSVVWMFNNYATNFVVENVTVDCANMDWSYNDSCYVYVSRNGDSAQFTGKTEIKNFDSEVAANAYNVAGTMTVSESVVLGGSVELEAGASLTAPEGLNVTTTVANSRVVYENGAYIVKTINYVAQIGEDKFESIQAAVDAADDGATVNVIADVSDEAVTTDKSITITGAVTLNNVSISGSTGSALTVSGLTFTGNSWINSNGAASMTVDGVTANVTPSNTAATNSRSAFISLGRSEQAQLKLTVTNSKIVSAGGSDPILGWAAITEATITGNTFGAENAHQNNSDSVKFMAIADGAVFTVTDNTVYSDYNGFVFGQNTTRGNAYTVILERNTFIGEADHVWLEVSGSKTCNATVLATSDNTVNGNAFTAADIKLHPNMTTFTGVLAVDAEKDAEGKLIGGTFTKEPIADMIAEGYEAKKDGDIWTIVESGLAGSGTEADPYQIGSLDDLILFRDSVNKGETKYNADGVYVALTADIDMASVNWSVNIGDDCSYTFDGIFDGNGKTISNLNATESAQKGDGYICTGLFGAIGGNAVVKNLTIENVNINTGDFVGNNAAAVVGFAYSCTGSVENVNVTGNIQINAKNVTGTGAIVGYDFYGKLTVKDCVVDGNDGSAITGAAYVGGIIGYASNNANLTENTVENVAITATSCAAGGIAGIMLVATAADNTIKNVTLAAGHENWQNSVASVVGTITSTVAVSGTTVDNVTTADGNAVPLVGAVHADKPTTPVAKVQAAIGNVYYTTFDKALAAAEEGATITLLDNLTGTVELAKSIALDVNGNTVEKIVLTDAAVTLTTEADKLNVTTTVADHEVKYDGTKYAVVEKATEPYIKINMDNMELGNNLALIFWVRQNQMLADVDYTAKMIRSFADGSSETVEVPESDWEPLRYGGVDYYRVKYDNFAAKEMTDQISFQVFDADGVAVSNVFTDTIREYAMFTIGVSTGSANAELRTAMIDMLNYGAAAQEEFGYKTDDKADKYLTAEHQQQATSNVSTVDHWKNPDKIGYASNLDLVSNIVLQIWFKNVTSDMYAEISYKNHSGDVVTDTVEFSEFTNREAYTGKKGIYSVPVDTLAVADGNCVVSCTLKKGDGTVVGTVEESVMSCLSYSNSSDPHVVYEPAMKFVTSAYNYFHD